MPRDHRICYLGAVYHITCRGNNKIDIFLDNEDCEKYIQYLLKAKAKYGFKLYAYALMKNHLHLLIEDAGKHGKPAISKIMASLNTSYSMHFNKKYNRSGHLYDNRFHSNIIEKENYLLMAVRYINLNPVNAGIVKKADDYFWCSHRNYLKDGKDFLIDKDFVLNILAGPKESKAEKYKKFINGGIKENKKFINEIEKCPSKTKIIGSQNFIKNIEKSLKITKI